MTHIIKNAHKKHNGTKYFESISHNMWNFNRYKVKKMNCQIFGQLWAKWTDSLGIIRLFTLLIGITLPNLSTSIVFSWKEEAFGGRDFLFE